MSCKNCDKLWKEYTKTKSPEIKEKLIIEYSYLVKYVAGRLNIYFGQNVEFDDLNSYGIFGLLDAIDKYDFNKGVKFETYASLRIRGAIIDSIRKADWIPRSLRQKQKELDRIMQEFENEYGRPASDEEMAEALGINVNEYHKLLSKTSAANLVSLDDYIEQNQGNVTRMNQEDKFKQPEEIIQKQEEIEILASLIDLLSDKEKKVITLYYYEELTLKEISTILGVSESRISQIHSKALMKLRTKMK